MKAQINRVSEDTYVIKNHQGEIYQILVGRINSKVVFNTFYLGKGELYQMPGTMLKTPPKWLMGKFTELMKKNQ